MMTRLQGGGVPTLTTLVALMLDLQGLGQGSPPADIRTTLLQIIGDVLLPLPKALLGVPAGRLRPRDRTEIGSPLLDATTTQEFLLQDDLPTGKLL